MKVIEEILHFKKNFLDKIPTMSICQKKSSILFQKQDELAKEIQSIHVQLQNIIYRNF